MVEVHALAWPEEVKNRNVNHSSLAFLRAKGNRAADDAAGSGMCIAPFTAA